MNMNEFKTIIKNDLKKIDVDIAKENGIYFSEKLGNHASGDYFFVDSKGFHYVSIDDRGNVEPEAVYRDLDDILFILYWGITSNLAIEYASINQKAGQDWRRALFSKQLELLQILGESYYTKGKYKIEEVLKNNPYNDTSF